MEVAEALPEIPNKLYFSISEAAELCAVKPHVLRFWESEFSVLSPAKRRGGRRFYQREDVLLVRRIRHLLYEEGFTIQGARARLSKQKSESKTEHTSQPEQNLRKSNDAGKTQSSVVAQLRELVDFIEN